MRRCTVTAAVALSPRGRREPLMTILYISPVFQEHATGRHPESPERLQAIERRLAERKLVERCTPGMLRTATPGEITRIHTATHLESVAEYAAAGGGRIEADTVVSPRSYAAATLAAGTACAAVDAILTGQDTTALCLSRPPGHHALADSAMGFCLFNNVAIAAEHALKVHDLERVLIVDWDVHHGNGTQDVFYEREDVTFLSSHRFPFYPGSGDSDETGRGRGLGYTFNLPIEFGTARRDFLEQFERILLAAATRSRPQLLLLSAGFDAHRLDPIGSLGLETEDYATLTRLVLDVAKTWCEGRVVSLLEGGYHVEALADSVALHLETMLS